ncbi:MAG: nucleotidyltransferase family protein [Promethearchaeota archaeon]
MLNKSQILSILRENYEELSKKFKVKRIGLFGSIVKNSETKDSDIDILVDFFEPITIFTFIDLEDFLSLKLDRKVDLVSEKGLKHVLKNNILKEVVYV